MDIFVTYKISLQYKPCMIADHSLVSLDNAVCTLKFEGSHGCNVFDHLAADTAGFLGGQVTVIAILQVYANLVGSFHLELVESFLSLRYYGTCHSYIHSLFFLIVPVQLPRTLLSAEPVFRWNQRRSLFPVLLCAVPPGSNMEYSG